MVSEEQYQEAKENIQFRQPFLDIIYHESPGIGRYVSHLVYIPLDVPYSTMFVAPSEFSRLWIPWTRSKIIVLPGSFSDHRLHRNLDDFLSILEDHELFHAIRYFKQPWSWGKLLWSEEYLAIQNQVDNFHRRNCSPSYQEELRKIALYLKLSQIKNVKN